ncbi:M15 family metallopeptidase [Demequina globuliformis]|uniref:M15 family metallopeptidase n=1 Tax=Demequina globuliformis TaxID=676202 RepID=UPI000B32F569|nr:hypothetical protein [Demequina globuliformis]
MVRPIAPHPHFFMTLFNRPIKPTFITLFALGGFTAGVLGAQGAFTVDTYVAVSQARVAAAELAERRAALDASLANADAVATLAADITDEAPVAEAAQELNKATSRATLAADAAPATEANEVSTSPVLTVAEAVTVTNAQTSTAPDIDNPQSALVRANDAVASAPTVTPTDDDSAASPVPDADPAATVADAPVADDTSVVASGDADGDAAGESADHVVRAIEGDVNDPDEARAAKADLEAAAAELDAALAEVDATAQELEAVTLAAQHARNLATVEENATQAKVRDEAVTSMLPALQGTLENPTTLVVAMEAYGALQDALAVEFDADDADSVADHVSQVSDATARFDDAVADVRESHTAWVDTENERRDEANEQAQEEYEDAKAKALSGWAESNRAAVNAHQNGWSGAPEGVSGSNGRVSSDSLCDIDFAPGHLLQCDAAASLERADADYYAQTGRHLEMTDSYRTYASQVATRAAKPGTAAVPGTSNHGWGMAVDFDYDAARWMAANGADYGWVHPAWARSGGSKPEWWHLEYVATSVGLPDAPDAPAVIEPAVNVFAEAEKEREEGDEDAE